MKKRRGKGEKKGKKSGKMAKIEKTWKKYEKTCPSNFHVFSPKRNNYGEKYENVLK